MSKHIGIRVNSYPSFAEMLYFDELVLVSAEDSVPGPESTKANISYLQEQGIIVPAHEYPGLNNAKFDTNLALLWPMLKTFPEQGLQPLDIAPWRSEANPTEVTALQGQLLGEIEKLLMAITLKGLQQVPSVFATPILVRSPDNADETKPFQTVLEITLRNIPVPLGDTSLEDIVQFRQDSDAWESLRCLRRWMSNISSKGMSPREIEDELEEALIRYRKHMAIHKMKCQPGTLRTLMGITLEMLDSLPRLKFKPAFDALFTFREQRIKMIEAEFNAPGREVAYIDLIGRRF